MNPSLRKIDLNLLVVFEALYATENTSRTAERLGMSQPAVSNALSRLRAILNDPLFVRHARGLTPTIKSHEIIRPVREALAVIGRQFIHDDEIDLATYRRLFRIIIIDPLEPIMMPAIVQKIATQAPGIEIESIQATAKFADAIREGTIDLACISFPIDTTDLVVKPICPIEAVIISRRDHPAIKKPLDAETFLQLPQVGLSRELRGMTTADKSLIAQDMTRRIPYMAAKIWSIPAMIQQTDLVSFMSRRFAEKIAPNFDLDIHEVPFEVPEQHMYMTWHVGSENDPGHRWLRETMLQAMKTNE